MLPYEISEIPAADYAVLNKYVFNPEIRKEDFISVKCEYEESKEMDGY